MALLKLRHLLCRGVAHVVYGIVVFVFVEVDLKRQYRKHLADVAAYAFNAPLFPCPYLRRYVIIDRYARVRTYILGNAEVEARVVDENHHVGAPLHDVALTHLHVTEYGTQMQQHRHKAHISQFAIVTHPCAADSRHEVAAKKAKLGVWVFLLQRQHEA